MMMNGSFLPYFLILTGIKRSVAQPLTPGTHCLGLPSAPPGSLDGGLDLDLLTSVNYMFEVYIKVRIWLIKGLRIGINSNTCLINNPWYDNAANTNNPRPTKQSLTTSPMSRFSSLFRKGT